MKVFKNNGEAHQQNREAVRLLDEISKSQIIDRYTRQDSFAELPYATVRDFCDSADHLPQICYLNGDLKNVQRPWIIKAILNKVPLGGKLLEIGGGIPLVAGMLAELGYQVTLVDPYEGAGNGPTEYEKYVQQFPHINIVRSTFGVDFNGTQPASFDCIYSVSVLEHIPQEGIKDIYEGIHKFLRPGGFSIHCVDNVIQGSGTQFHEDTVRLVLQQQKQLKEPNCDFDNEYDELLIQLKDDLETFYLSALGHHLWRGGKSYEDFPFRKVVSIQTCVSMTGNNPWNAEQPVSYGEMWLGSEECLKHISKKITGEENSSWLSYALKNYLAPALGKAESSKPREDYRCLLLGSNEGHMEQTLCENGFIGEIVASDIADKALARAKQKIEALGYSNVNYILADLNTDSFDGTFDYIIAEGVLHHISNIEGCLRMLESKLADNGIFITVEFVGAVRFQLPELQVRWINAALSALPKTLRPFPQSDEEYLPPSTSENLQIFYVCPTEESIIDLDPSEALSGPALKQLLPQIFQIVERKGFGGTLLSYMTGHFDFKRTNTDDFANSWVKILIQIEDTLIETGILEDDFVFYVLKPREKIELTQSS